MIRGSYFSVARANKNWAHFLRHWYVEGVLDNEKKYIRESLKAFTKRYLCEAWRVVVD